MLECTMLLKKIMSLVNTFVTAPVIIVLIGVCG